MTPCRRAPTPFHGNLVDYAIEYRVHATRRMFQRPIGAEEVAFILTHGQVIERYDEDFPLPSVLMHGRTMANRPLHVVVGINVDEQQLVIITTYEPDALQWADNFSRRIVCNALFADTGRPQMGTPLLF